MQSCAHSFFSFFSFFFFFARPTDPPSREGERWETKHFIGMALNGLAKSLRVLRSSWILNESNLFCKIVEYCILHRGLYDKNSASWYCFTSDVMYKKYKRLVYTSPDLLARFCKVNLPNAKKKGPDLFSRPNLLWSTAIMALKCDRKWLLFFGCTYKAINSV